MKRGDAALRGKARSFYRGIDLTFRLAGTTGKNQWMEYPRSAAKEFHEAMTRFSEEQSARGWPAWFRKFCHYGDRDPCGVRVEVLASAARSGGP